jgi:hypothetical protein
MLNETTLTDVMELMAKAICFCKEKDEQNIDNLVKEMNTVFLANDAQVNDIICAQILVLLTLATSWKRYLCQYDNPSTDIPPYLQG